MKKALHSSKPNRKSGRVWVNLYVFKQGVDSSVVVTWYLDTPQSHVFYYKRGAGRQQILRNLSLLPTHRSTEGTQTGETKWSCCLFPVSDFINTVSTILIWNAWEEIKTKTVINIPSTETNNGTHFFCQREVWSCPA